MQLRLHFALHGNHRVKEPHVQFSFSLNMKIHMLITFREYLYQYIRTQYTEHTSYRLQYFQDLFRTEWNTNNIVAGFL